MVPEKLKSGDEVRIIAPSRSMSMLGEDCIELATNRLKEMGLIVTFGKHVLETDNDYVCASIKSRAEDLNEAFADKNVKAILTVIGGFNSNSILDYIDFDNIKNNPKIFCGYSDITALSNSIYAKTGLVTYYGPHFSTFGMKKGCEYIIDKFKAMFFGEGKVDVDASETWSNDAWFLDQENRDMIDNKGMFIINEGEAEGQMLAGNLCTLNLLQGTEYMPDISNKILFLEDDGMAGKLFLVEFDRNLQSLMHMKEFKTVRGIVLGRAEKVSEMTDEKWIKMIKSKEALKNIPVIAGADFGHTTPMATLPIGGNAKIVAKNGKVSIVVEG